MFPSSKWRSNGMSARPQKSCGSVHLKQTKAHSRAIRSAPLTTMVRILLLLQASRLASPLPDWHADRRSPSLGATRANDFHATSHSASAKSSFSAAMGSAGGLRRSTSRIRWAMASDEEAACARVAALSWRCCYATTFRLRSVL